MTPCRNKQRAEEDSAPLLSATPWRRQNAPGTGIQATPFRPCGQPAPLPAISAGHRGEWGCSATAGAAAIAASASGAEPLPCPDGGGNQCPFDSLGPHGESDTRKLIGQHELDPPLALSSRPKLTALFPQVRHDPFAAASRNPPRQTGKPCLSRPVAIPPQMVSAPSQGPQQP